MKIFLFALGLLFGQGVDPVNHIAAAAAPLLTTTFYATPTATQASFTLPVYPGGALHVFRNGLRMMPGLDYSTIGETVTFAAKSIPQAGDQVIIDY